MLNLHRFKVEPFVEHLEKGYFETFGLMQPDYATILRWAGSLVLEKIANCDCLYHNVDHTIMVTLVGQEILRGKHLNEGNVTPHDWLHYILSLLCHDIGYLRGVCSQDCDNFVDTGIKGKLVEVPVAGTDASLTPYHVARSIVFIRERFKGNQNIDAEVLARNIEMTRFPPTELPEGYDTASQPGLTRAADFIGQLADPDYLRKIPALFYEFEETGTNKDLGYENPGAMRHDFARFFWDAVNPYIQDALEYLKVTQEGKQWIASLHSHVFRMEHF